MYTIREAKASFAKLIEKAIQGEEVIITRRGKPVVKIVTVSAQQAKRVPGRWKGKVSYAPIPLIQCRKKNWPSGV